MSASSKRRRKAHRKWVREHPRAAATVEALTAPSWHSGGWVVVRPDTRTARLWLTPPDK